VLFETTLWEFPEQPKMLNRKPVDTNKKTFFILVSSQSVRRGPRLGALKFEVPSVNHE
jgi:hypothetical protein